MRKGSIGSPIKARALKYRAEGRQNIAALVAEVRAKLAAGTAPPCYARTMLENREKHAELDDVEFNGAHNSLFGAGVDTTSATLQSLVLAMAAHPAALAAAHAELDAVVGAARVVDRGRDTTTKHKVTLQ